jgi:phenol 2-monooxygenase
MRSSTASNFHPYTDNPYTDRSVKGGAQSWRTEGIATMQFYLDGYKPGDPLMHAPHPAVAERPQGPPSEVDVLIVGCGPAGLVLAAQLANCPEIRTAIVDRRDGPLDVGQADGVACRTVEIFETFGLADRLVSEAYWVNEVCFWQPDPDDRTKIKRTGRVRDTEEGLSEFPHVIVNQARMLAYLLEHMERSSTKTVPHNGLHLETIEIDADGSSPYPVFATLSHVGNFEPTGETSTIRAKYLVGCDGSRSVVRNAIGRKLVGDAMNVSWGVIDALTITDFPDIRMKCTVHSADEGSLLIIPREGGYLARFYIELDAERDRDMLENGRVTPEKLAGVANRILHPYSIDVKDIGWWSVYDIGQRLTDRFDDVPADEVAHRLPRVFIAGDACHTHSAKAGQGMNVSMADTWNLGWKLVSVLRGTAKSELLHTYSEERQRVAQELIDFDLEFATMFSARPKHDGDASGGGIDPEEFHRYFVQQGRFTAGLATRYLPSLITNTPKTQELATGFPVGMRFHSAPVIRLADAKPLELGHIARADGAWRLYVFADRPHPAEPDSRARSLFDFLGSDLSPLARFTPPGWAPDSVIDVRAIFQQPYRELSPSDLPWVLLPRKGRFGLVDYEKAFCPDPSRADIFDLRGIDRDRGCVVVVRPDQYVSDVLPLAAHDTLTAFFDRILTRAS